jgi:methyl coenzyme M reductase beta subunit
MLIFTRNALLSIIVIASANTVAQQPVQLIRVVPYAENADIQKKVREECKELGSQLSSFTQKFGKEFKVDIQLVDAIDTQAKGRVLKLEIFDAVSMGNAFLGHQKYSRSRGTLYENGTKIAEFRARRNSMGGAFAGYKGSCSVLGRTVKAMGKDIALWLKDPKDGDELGD